MSLPWWSLRTTIAAAAAASLFCSWGGTLGQADGCLSSRSSRLRCKADSSTTAASQQLALTRHGNAAGQLTDAGASTAGATDAATSAAAAAAAGAAAMRKQQNKKTVSSVVHPPERHISVDPHELKLAIKNKLKLSDRVLFDDLTKLMEGVANFDFYDLKQRMRNHFLPFSCGARNNAYLQRSGTTMPTADELNRKEDEFISDVYEVLAASHYTLLTKEEWELATVENFNLNLPMEVNWEYMDHELLTKFWASSPSRKALRKMLPDCMADRVLVFHRGIGTAQLEGILFEQKLDLLMDYTVFHVLDTLQHLIHTLTAKLLGLTAQSGLEAEGPAEADCTGGAAASGAAVRSYDYEEGAMIASRHRHAKRVERQSLQRQCPTLLTLLQSFPLSMSLQEPTFKDVVVVYRRAAPPRQPPTAPCNAVNPDKEQQLLDILTPRNINIKVFGETPMADVEIVFPDKVVGIRPFQLVNLAGTLGAALVAGALVLTKASNININILWTAASLVATRCFQVYTDAQTQRTLMQQEMTSSLYDKMQDSQEGVISVITEELADQQLKQMLLAYMLLIIEASPMLPDDLDTTVEDFLMKEFEHPIDYDWEASLPRLKSWGLVQVNKQGKLEVLPMSEAIAVLQQAWSVAYKEVGKEGEGRVPTIDMITGAYSVFREGIERHQKQRRAAAEASTSTPEKAGWWGKATRIFTVGSGDKPTPKNTSSNSSSSSEE